MRIPGRPVDAYTPWYLPVSPGFLRDDANPADRRAGLRLARCAAGQPSAVIVNESFARRYFPGESPVGKRFFASTAARRWSAQDIVGVAGDAKYTDLRERRRRPSTNRTGRKARQCAGTDAAGNRRVDRHAPRGDRTKPPAFRLTNVTLQSTLVDNHMVRDRALALLSAFFSIVAIVLVVVGLYGVLSSSVVRRRRGHSAVGASEHPLEVSRLVDGHRVSVVLHQPDRIGLRAEADPLLEDRLTAHVLHEAHVGHSVQVGLESPWASAPIRG